MIRQFERLSQRIRRRLLLMVTRAVLLLIDDERKMQVVQVRGLKNEVLDGVERVQQYGFTSHPHPGAEVVVVSVGGMRQHPLAVAIDDRRYRIVGLARGEVCIYSDEDEEGRPHRVILRRGRAVEVRGDVIRLVARRSSLVMDDNDVLINSPHIGLND